MCRLAVLAVALWVVAGVRCRSRPRRRAVLAVVVVALVQAQGAVRCPPAPQLEEVAALQEVLRLRRSAVAAAAVVLQTLAFQD